MRRKLIVGLALAALLLGGCSSTGDSSAPTAGNGGAAPKEAAPPVDSLSKGDADKQAATDGTATTAGSVDNRSLIYRGDITVRVDDVEKAADQVEAMATTLGGHVDSQKRVAGTENANASITIRVPSKEFDAAFDRIAALGKEQNRSSNVEDVTEAVVDLDSRITAQQASLDATLKIYQQATAISDVIALRKEVAQQQADLAVLQAKKRRLDDLIALSTITAILIGPNTDIPVEKTNPGFLDGLKAGWDAFVTSVRVLLVVTGWLLPFLLAVAIPIIVLVWISRARRRRRLALAQPPQSGETSA
jgi:hypothetical protein